MKLLKKVGISILFLLVFSLIVFADYTYNPFISNLDYYSKTNYSKLNDTIDEKLTSTYISPSTSSARSGTVDGGNLSFVNHTGGSYDGRTFNFSEVAGSPGLDLRMNFSGVDDFNRGIMRYMSGSLSGSYPVIQVWSYDDSDWEDYPFMAESLTFATIEQGVFDSTEHISGGVVQMRLYKSSNGNINNHYFVDWVSIVDGVGIPSGAEIDPYSVHKTGDTMTGHLNVYSNFTVNQSDFGIIVNSTDIYIGDFSLI